MESQRKRVLAHLMQHRWITKDIALDMGITRIPVFIQRLRKQGYPILHVDDGSDSMYLLNGELYELLQSRVRPRA